MASPSKVFAVVSSILGSVQETSSSYAASYRVSKAALNMACKTLACEESVQEGGGKVLVIHPGWVDTDMGRAGGRNPPLTVEQSAAGIAQVIDRAVQHQGAQQAGADSGDDIVANHLARNSCVYVDYKGDVLPW